MALVECLFVACLLPAIICLPFIVPFTVLFRVSLLIVQFAVVFFRCKLVYVALVNHICMSQLGLMIPAYELAINSSFRTRGSINNCILNSITGLMGIVLDSFNAGLL